MSTRVAAVYRKSASLLLFLLFSVITLHAGTFTVFGPKNYVRGTGSPVTVTDSFSVFNPAAQYTLKAYNGGLTNSSTELVSSSIVTLNGVQVLGPNNFNQNVTEVDIPVALQASNTLSVQVRGTPGGVLAIQIVGVDNDPPTIKAAVSPTPNSAGWNNTTVTVTFTCGDGTSGVASCPPSQTVTTEGANQVISGTATDNAGNTANATIALNIAKTPSKITASALPAANSNGWNNSNVTVNFSCAATTAPVATCTPAQTVSSDGAGQIITGAATDVAGNSASASVTINLDKTPPIIKATAAPPPNASGVNTTDVTVTFSCSDATSGVASCPPPQAVTTAGANQVISGAATDNAGNTASASLTLTIIRAAPPVITASLSPPANAAGWNNSNVTVTFTCSGGSGGIASCAPPVTVSTEGANQVVTGTAVDQSGQTATASVTLNLDLTPPVVTSTVSPSPNGAGWNHSNVMVRFQCNDSLSGVASCPSPVPVTNESITVVQSAPATDVAGNSATTSVLVELDMTPPTVTITSPAAGANAFATQTMVSGTVNDALSGVVSVSCNGAQAQLSGSTFTCTTALATGANTISVTTADVAGNTGITSSSVTLIPAPVVTISSPANLSFTNITPITVRGTVDNSADTVTISGIAAFPSNGTFSAQVPLNEGVNTLTALASNAGGNQATASVNVTLDTTPPHLTIDAPANNSITASSAVTVTGTVNDIVVGTVNDQNAQVTVNGTAAQVANRTYSIANVPLALGANAIQAIARDQAGNATTLTIIVTRVAPNQPPAPAIGQAVVADNLTIVSGNNQTATIATQLQSPLVVSLMDPSGKPVPNQPVVFKVTANDGTVATSSSNGASAIVITDSNGMAQVSWTLGHRSGVGVNQVEASSAVAFDVADFSAVGLSGTSAQIVVDSGDNQAAVAGQALTFPFAAVVTDVGHNRLPGVPVTFTVVTGGGSLSGNPAQLVTTDSDGRALATLTLGPAGGSINVVRADFAGDQNSAAAFTALSKVAGDPSKTTISGEVLDNSNNPISNVTMRLYQTNQGSNNNLPLQIGASVLTDAQGYFVIANAPLGYFKLMADGSTAGAGVTTYPTLEYDIVTVAGQDNNVGTPIYLPVLNTVNKLCVDATHGGTLTLPQAPGFSLNVLPGAATFPGGSRQGCVSVSTVNGDKVPMTPGFGQQPRFIVTIQPVGTVFNPPAAMTLPNVEGLSPRSKTEMYSYDHDLSMFVAIGTATVSADGSVIASDPGTGVLKAGWHCGGDPNKTGNVAHCNDCQVCNGAQCLTNPFLTAGFVAACSDQAGDYVSLQGPNLEFSIAITIDSSCRGQCDGNGNCNPSSAGFGISAIAGPLSEALEKIFDNSNKACIGPNLMNEMQINLQRNGLTITCDSDPSSWCAKTPSLGGNKINVNTVAMTTGNGCEANLASTLLHELVHGPGGSEGYPDVGYHNHNDGSPDHPIDCRDVVYGCEESCFPGSTVAGGLGNKFACLEGEPRADEAINGCDASCGGRDDGLGGCRTVPQ